MYWIGHKVFKLDGVITEFADIYAPLSQVWKESGKKGEKKSSKKRCEKKFVKMAAEWL